MITRIGTLANTFACKMSRFSKQQHFYMPRFDHARAVRVRVRVLSCRHMSAYTVGCMHTSAQVGTSRSRESCLRRKKHTVTRLQFAITRSSPLSLKSLFPQSLSRPTTHEYTLTQVDFFREGGAGDSFRIGLDDSCWRDQENKGLIRVPRLARVTAAKYVLQTAGDAKHVSKVRNSFDAEGRCVSSPSTV